jgi:hypothetical protein
MKQNTSSASTAEYPRFYTRPATGIFCPVYLNSITRDSSMLISHKWAMSDTLNMLSHPEREKPLTQAGAAASG